MQNGSLHRLTITDRGGSVPTAGTRGKVRLETDDLLQPALEIPVQYLAPSPPPPKGPTELNRKALPPSP